MLEAQVMWWDGDEQLRSRLSMQLLRWLQQCEQRAVVIGWGPSEIGVVQALAAHAVAIHASDWAVNMASYASFYAPVLRQRLPRAASAAALAPQRGKHTVTFLLSDGDNLQVKRPLRRGDRNDPPAPAVADWRQLRLACQRLVGQQQPR